MTEIDIVCSSCGEDLVVTVNDVGDAYGLCPYCEEPIEVIDGEVYDPLAEDGESW